MSSVHPFAGCDPRPSPWGYNWTAEEAAAPPSREEGTARHPSLSPEPRASTDQYANLPAALLGTLKREKKPFTYTPGGVNLSEVLEARLQKRLERKKRYSEERAREEPPRQVVVMPTYNSPLDMYSMENALEALEVQAEMVVAADKSTSPRSATLPRNYTFRFEEKDLDPGRGVAQSKAFRVLQIITDTEDESTERSGDAHCEEMRFSGIRESKAIPSRFFHALQKITGTEEQEDKRRQLVDVARPMLTAAPFPTQKPDSVHRQAQQHGAAATTLRRPAAFLPIKTSSSCSGFRPVQPSAPVSNGPLRRVGNPVAGTDF